MTFDPSQDPHRRYNQLSGEYVLVAPHRLQRPWRGQVEKAPHESLPSYDPTCYLCPGNERSGGQRNADYTTTYVFPNDFPSLLPNPKSPEAKRLNSKSHLLRAKPVHGACRVLCFSPRHDLTLPQMPLAEIRGVVDVWALQTAELGQTHRWVQLFENKGAIMGCSNPHPHGQIWGMDALPNEAAKEDEQQRQYFQEHGSPLLLDYAELELELDERIVVQDDHWLAVVPYWAMWPFETLLLPRRHVRRLPDLQETERDALAAILKRLLTRYDNLFQTSFPYAMGWHGAPFNPKSAEAERLNPKSDHWQLHAHFYPPLLRSATVKKFMVGFEMLGEPVRDLTPEQAAARLRNLSEVHYLS
jgi:UDPglucose--hexose-1-phosphate uridylyltransferase